MMLFDTRANVMLGMTMGLSGLWLVSVPRLVIRLLIGIGDLNDVQAVI